MDVLIKANVQHCKIAVFPSGVVLNVPEVDITSAEYDDGLPPWKQVGGA